MSKQIILLVLSLFLCQMAFTQDCKGYFPFIEDTTYELTTYDKKGDMSVIVENTVAIVKPDGDNFRAVIQSQIKDEDGEEIALNKFDVTCSGETFYIDATAFINPNSMSAYQNMDMELRGNGVELPTTLSVGQELAEASTEVKVSSNDITVLKMNVIQENREVVKQEEITTSAGTFDCYVISYDSTMKMIVKKTNQVKEWYAKGVGMVRQEIYNKKGKLEAYTELTKISTL